MNRISISFSVVISIVLFALSGCSGTGNYPDGESRYQPFAPDGIPFKVASDAWSVDKRGNHRAVVTVSDASAGGVVAELPWRRPDLRIEKKVIVTDSEDNEIKDVIVTALTPERGEVVFRPAAGEGRYYIYYLPYDRRFHYGSFRFNPPQSDYYKPVYDADRAWLGEMSGKKGQLPKAAVDCFESVSRYDFWSPMGLIATDEEIAAVKSEAGKDMVIFPEDRAFPIQPLKRLPAKWVKAPEPVFHGLAMRNEYYTWQLGVWAAGKDLKNVRVGFSEFRNGKAVIGTDSMTCFNQEGTNWDDTPLEFTVDVPEGRVQALWCGVQVPEDARPGTYRGTATVTADGEEPQVIQMNIKVLRRTLADSGDSETWRHSRLRWLNSTLAQDDEPVAPFKEMNVEGNVIEATGKKVALGANGMVSQVTVNGKDVFQSPQQILVSTPKGDVVFKDGDLQIEKKAAGLVTWTSTAEQDGIRFDLKGNMEFDGFIHFDINVSSEEGVEAKDIRLVSVYTPYSSEYFMGVGHNGGFTPVRHTFKWDGPYDGYWIGGVEAGLHTEFRGSTYHGPLINEYRPAPPKVWGNGGLGTVTVNAVKGKSATVTASTGRIAVGSDPLNCEFNLLVTPVKELNPAKHFSERYFHDSPVNFDKAAGDGANVCNIHHAGKLNPFINYPYIVRDSLIDYIKYHHGKGRKVKLYYTVRELSTHCEEVFAFHSLNHEIFITGPGYGLPWECEHLVDDYSPAWYTPLWDDIMDASLVMTPNSRYLNYFVEGLRWMVENYDLDGTYMDDVSFDRLTIKRLRKVLERYHDGALIDLHSHRGYSQGPANQYTSFFPYVDRLWFGEDFHYDDMTPDKWLVTFSGIPFGVMSEMLEGGGNRFLGMVYGTTARHESDERGEETSPVPVWKLWDEFGIKDARMVGYWDTECPVRTSDQDVKATAYVKDGSTLVSIGNFSDRDKNVRLSIDFKALGLDPAFAKITAPSVKNFQEERAFKPGEIIPVKAKQGWLLLISK